MSSGAAGGAAAAQAAIAKAIKASGAIVSVDPAEFLSLLERAKDSLVVVSKGGLFWSKHCYLFNYKGLIFYTKSAEALELPTPCETILARGIWVPG
jgi:hypothetical protein